VKSRSLKRERVSLRDQRVPQRASSSWGREGRLGQNQRRGGATIGGNNWVTRNAAEKLSANVH